MSHYLGYEDYTRISTVADAVARFSSDGLFYAGAAVAAKRALDITQDVFSGSVSDSVQYWKDSTGKSDLTEYLVSSNFKEDVTASAKRSLQCAADRGTITGILADKLFMGEISGVNAALDFVNEHIDDYNESARLNYDEYIEAKRLGLLSKPSDDKPVRNYQCSVYDVIPYCTNLVRWWESPGKDILQAQSCQNFSVDEESKVVGTDDYRGVWDNSKSVIDLKTSTNQQPSLYHVTQGAKYLHQSGLEQCVMLIVTPEGVYPRVMSQAGYEKGLRLFYHALAMIQDKSMAGMFLPSRQAVAK